MEQGLVKKIFWGRGEEICRSLYVGRKHHEVQTVDAEDL